MLPTPMTPYSNTPFWQQVPSQTATHLMFRGTSVKAKPIKTTVLGSTTIIMQAKKHFDNFTSNNNRGRTSWNWLNVRNSQLDVRCTGAEIFGRGVLVESGLVRSWFRWRFQWSKSNFTWLSCYIMLSLSFSPWLKIGESAIKRSEIRGSKRRLCSIKM